MLPFREYKEKNVDYMTLLGKDQFAEAAIRYKGKIYTGFIHDTVLRDMVYKHKIPARELDDNLDINDFGFSIDRGRTFIEGDSDAAKRLNWARKNKVTYVKKPPSKVKSLIDKHRERRKKLKESYSHISANQDDENYRAAIQYKGKVYTGVIHYDALLQLRKLYTEKELDANLSEKNFGYVVKGKFHTGFSDYGWAKYGYSKKNKLV